MILAALLLLQANTDSLAAHVRQLADSYLVAYFERHPDEATLGRRCEWAARQACRNKLTPRERYLDDAEDVWLAG